MNRLARSEDPAIGRVPQDRPQGASPYGARCPTSALARRSLASRFSASSSSLQFSGGVQPGRRVASALVGGRIVYSRALVSSSFLVETFSSLTLQSPAICPVLRASPAVATFRFRPAGSGEAVFNLVGSPRQEPCSIFFEQLLGVAGPWGLTAEQRCEGLFPFLGPVKASSGRFERF